MCISSIFFLHRCCLSTCIYFGWGPVDWMVRSDLHMAHGLRSHSWCFLSWLLVCVLWFCLVAWLLLVSPMYILSHTSQGTTPVYSSPCLLFFTFVRVCLSVCPDFKTALTPIWWHPYSLTPSSSHMGVAVVHLSRWHLGVWFRYGISSVSSSPVFLGIWAYAKPEEVGIDWPLAIRSPIKYGKILSWWFLNSAPLI